MRLEVVEAKDLKRADTKVFGKGGKSDPYCKIVGKVLFYSDHLSAVL